ncbi:nicotinate-nucleotide--dimethylbenzimidazole phosphoribosyltransferase [Bacillaceae bacterium]
MIQETIRKIGPLDAQAMQRAQEHLNRLTKPQGSLGRLEDLIVQLAGITGEEKKVFRDKRVVVMAADHGVAAEGVSAYPQEVTRQMVANFLAGGAAINAFARQAGASVTCVDVGVAADLSHLSGLLRKKVAFGTRNMLHEPAMTREEAEAAVRAGIEVATEEVEKGADLLATGEMGIGNTTASSAVLAVLAGLLPEQVVGQGTGISEAGWRRKVQVVKEAIARHRPDVNDPLDVLSKVGGLELCALAGLVLGAAARRVPVVIDGFISSVAAFCAVRLCPQARAYLVPSHESQEPGHRLVLRAMELEPVLRLDMRLGEGTGAALVFPLIDAAARVMREMATFEQAGVAERSDGDGQA